jgi:hypothetical protein
VRHPPSARAPPTGHVPYVVAKASKAAPPPSANLYASAPAPTSAPRLPHAGVASFERVGAGTRAQSFPRANAPSAPRRRLFFRQREAAHCVAPPPSLGVLHVRRALERGCGFGRARPLLGSEALLRPSATRNEVLRRLLLVLVVMQGSMRTLASAAQTEEELIPCAADCSRPLAPARALGRDITFLEGSHWRSLKVESSHKDVAQTGVQLVQSNAFSNAHLFGFWMSG